MRKVAITKDVREKNIDKGKQKKKKNDASEDNARRQNFRIIEDGDKTGTGYNY